VWINLEQLHYNKRSAAFRQICSELFELVGRLLLASLTMAK